MSFDADIDAEFEAAADNVPAERQNNYGGGTLGKLPDGPHTFIVTDGELTTGNFIIYQLKFTVRAADGQEITGEKKYFLKGKDGPDTKRINELKADLATLGFDTANWTQANGKPFLVQLARIKPVLPGIQFKGKKKTNANKSDPKNPYLNVYLDERADGDGKPKVLDEKTVSELVLASADPF